MSYTIYHVNCKNLLLVIIMLSIVVNDVYGDTSIPTSSYTPAKDAPARYSTICSEDEIKQKSKILTLLTENERKELIGLTKDWIRDSINDYHEALVEAKFDTRKEEEESINASELVIDAGLSILHHFIGGSGSKALEKLVKKKPNSAYKIAAKLANSEHIKKVISIAIEKGGTRGAKKIADIVSSTSEDVYVFQRHLYFSFAFVSRRLRDHLDCLADDDLLVIWALYNAWQPAEESIMKRANEFKREIMEETEKFNKLILSINSTYGGILSRGGRAKSTLYETDIYYVTVNGNTSLATIDLTSSTDGFIWKDKWCHYQFLGWISEAMIPWAKAKHNTVFNGIRQEIRHFSQNVEPGCNDIKYYGFPPNVSY